MQQKRSRCGTVIRARFGPRASTVASLGLLALLVTALPASGQAPDAVAGSVTIVIHGQGRVTSDPIGAIDCPGSCSLTFAGSTSLTLRAIPANGFEIYPPNAKPGKPGVVPFAKAETDTFER